jgi:hypothetical protein
MAHDVLSLLSLELRRWTCSITGAARLGQVFDARGGAGRRRDYSYFKLAVVYGIEDEREHTWISRHVFAVDEIALDIEEVPSFIQLAVMAADRGFMAGNFRQSGQDVAQLICLGRTGGDAGSGESLGRQPLYDSNSMLMHTLYVSRPLKRSTVFWK